MKAVCSSSASSAAAAAAGAGAAAATAVAETPKASSSALIRSESSSTEMPFSSSIHSSVRYSHRRLLTRRRLSTPLSPRPQCRSELRLRRLLLGLVGSPAGSCLGLGSSELASASASGSPAPRTAARSLRLTRLGLSPRLRRRRLHRLPPPAAPPARASPASLLLARPDRGRPRGRRSARSACGRVRRSGSRRARRAGRRGPRARAGARSR